MPVPFDLSSDLVASTPVVTSVVGQILIVLGGLLFATAAIGLVRLPDVYTRASAISTAAGFGLASIVTGTFLFVPGIDNAIKLVLAVILQLVTSAVGSMTIARSAYLTGSAVYSPSHHDELASDAQAPGQANVAPHDVQDLR